MTAAQVYDALFARLADREKVAVEYATRKWVTPTDLSSVGRMPALELAVFGWTNEQNATRPGLSTLTAVVLLYVKATDNEAAVAQLLALCGQVDTALRAQPDERGLHTTLGGLVHHAWVTQVEIDEGDVSGYATAQVTIEVLAVLI